MAPKTNNTVLRKSGKAGGKQAASLTREQIEDHLAAFRKAGGKIEVLGITRYPPQAPAKPKTPHKPKAKPPTPVA